MASKKTDPWKPSTRGPAEVAKRIAEAKTRKLSPLDLSNCGLQEIPEDIFALVDLISLDLSDNALKTVPSRLLDSLPKLRQIILLGNPLETVPPPARTRLRIEIDGQAFRRCGRQLKAQNLHVLFGTDESMDDADFLIGELSHGFPLASLTLGTRAITIGEGNREMPTVPLQKVLDSLAGFSGLQQLSLHCIKLDSVPVGISQLSRLKSLGLNGLDLTKLPDWIGTLNLEIFTAMVNQLTELPASFSRLRTLKTLRLMFSPLKHIPIVIFDMPWLQFIILSNCEIREIPPSILRLDHLQALSISHNPLESPPPEVADKGLDAIRDYWR